MHKLHRENAWQRVYDVIPYFKKSGLTPAQREKATELARELLDILDCENDEADNEQNNTANSRDEDEYQRSQGR